MILELDKLTISAITTYLAHDLIHSWLNPLLRVCGEAAHPGRPDGVGTVEQGCFTLGGQEAERWQGNEDKAYPWRTYSTCSAFSNQASPPSFHVLSINNAVNYKSIDRFTHWLGESLSDSISTGKWYQLGTSASLGGHIPSKLQRSTVRFFFFFFDSLLVLGTQTNREVFSHWVSILLQAHFASCHLKSSHKSPSLLLSSSLEAALELGLCVSCCLYVVSIAFSVLL